MRMDPDDIKNYPKFRYYVSTNIPQVRGMPFIINALKKFSGNASEQTIKDGLLWNKGPTIELVPGLVCGGVKASGCYTTGTDVIQIKQERVDEFEADKGLKHTASGRLVYFVGLTLLHEYCHWANNGTGSPDQTHAKFEQTLYGKVIDASDN
ncbi:hypothetical protein [Paludisphaera mucosa]|uniref:Tox-MPTase3 domain-containing protein n=1 Tax=Paludisphaera mucosa TaxID=3030827 RepID=A0ABT6FAY0_9BACT|nr:hypothetical protein [Paludisphaera mucosa]MDG3004540.1 hypothetical protein [Paludisphaera mucosa]